jgi:hypothetical protein
MGIGANSGYEHEPRNPGRSCLPRDILGASYVHGFEGHPTLLNIDRDRIDHGVGLLDGGSNRGFLAHIGGDDGDPFETHRWQLNLRPVGVPHSDTHSHPFGGQAVYQSPTKEAPTAKHDNRRHPLLR